VPEGLRKILVNADKIVVRVGATRTPAILFESTDKKDLEDLLHAAEIVIEPIQGFLKPWRERQAMAGVQQDLALVRCRRCPEDGRKAADMFRTELQSRIDR
jgi:hypothetical protein